MTYMTYSDEMLQKYYEEIIYEYLEWLKSKPSKFHFIKLLKWYNQEPDFAQFMHALECYEGELNYD